MDCIYIPDNKPITTIHLWYDNNEGMIMGTNKVNSDSKKTIHYLRGLEFISSKDGLEESIAEIGIPEGVQKTYNVPENSAIVGAKAVEDDECVRRLEFMFMTFVN